MTFDPAKSVKTVRHSISQGSPIAKLCDVAQICVVRCLYGVTSVVFHVLVNKRSSSFRQI